MSTISQLQQSLGAVAELRRDDSFEIVSQLLFSTRDCVKLLDLDGRILWMNPEGQERLGIRDFGKVVGRPWVHDWEGSHRHSATLAIAEARASRASRFEGMLRSADGEEIWWDVSVTSARDEDGRPRYLIAVSREITERKLAELELQAHKDHLQLIADNVPALMAYVDSDGRYQWANRGYETWYGLKPSEMVGRKSLEVLSENVSPEYADQIKPYLARALRGEKVRFEAVNEHRGKRREVQLTYVPDTARDGRVRGFVLQVTDLTEERRRQTELRASEEQFRTLAEALPSVVWAATPEGEIDYISERFLEITGVAPEGGMGDLWQAVIHPEDLPETVASWLVALQGESRFDARYRIRHKDRGYRWFLARALPQRDDSGRVIRWVGVTTDVHDQVTAEQALRESEERYRMLFEDNPYPMWIYDAETLRFTAVNDTAVRSYGYSREEFRAMTVADIRPNEDVPALLGRLHSLEPGKTEPVRHKRKDGSVFWVEVTTHPVSTPQGTLSFVLAQDVTDRVRLEEELRRRAQHDSLTGVPNLSLLAERFEHAAQDARRTGQKLAILSVDFDRFKQINDTFGHRIGDEFLKASVQRMQQILRSSETLARVGGDEFTIIAGPFPGEQDCWALAERLVEAQRTRMSVQDLELPSSVSVGVTVFPDDGESLSDLLRRADYGLYQAKRAGRNCCRRYSSEDRMGVREALQIERLLRNAPERGRLVLHYQPQFASDGAVNSMEALLRLRDDTLDLIPPARFIAIAEETGAINALGTWVLNEVCRQMAEWRASGLKLVPLAINVSSAQFARGEFAQEVQMALQQHRLEPELLELELTESLLMENLEQSREQLALLRQIGVRIAMDDFGTGYSSLSYLDALPLDTIKIDRSFIGSVGIGRSSTILKAIVEMGRGMGLSVVAEGVETEEQRAELVRLSCDRLQGFLLGMPTPAETAMRLISLL